jgi:hypothetical protein
VDAGELADEGCSDFSECSENDPLVRDLEEARVQLGLAEPLDGGDAPARAEAADELVHLVADAEDIRSGLTELEHIRSAIREQRRYT